MAMMTFDDLFDELRTARGSYEELRIAGGPLEQRAEMLTRLHGLRAAIAHLRQED